MDSGLVFAGTLPSSTISAMVRRGDLVRLSSGVYTADTTTNPEYVVTAHWAEIAGHLVPGGVITDRSARTGGPVGGVLYLARDGRARDIRLPGLRIRVRNGAAPQSGDIAYPGGLHLASTGRALAENSVESRSRAGNRARTLDEAELGDWIDHLCRRDGEDGLERHHRQAEELAAVLSVADERLARMHALVGAAVGTRSDESARSGALAAHAAGRPVDQSRVERFERLVEGLRGSAPQNRPVDGADTFEPFAEAYFSNFIEGTEFEFDEAARIVYDGEMPRGRPKDAHDVLGTYRLLADRDEMRQVGASGDEFLAILRRRHARIMEGRPEAGPGEFKRFANRAAATVFVDPDLVAGTLTAGFRLREQLDTPWERAVLIAFVVAEVHPFDDGNGRAARAMMSGELDAGGQVRIIVPTVFRDDYLSGLRMLSRANDPAVFIKAMRFAHDFTASIDFDDYRSMRDQLDEANAFNEPESADRLRVLTGRRVRRR